MERDCKRKKQKKKESSEKRSPLQNLNRLPFHHPITKKSSIVSSSSSAPSNSLSFSSYLHSRINHEKGSKTVCRSKRNQISQKSNKNHPVNRNPTCRSGIRPKLSSAEGNSENKLKNGSQEIQAKVKNSRGNGSGKRAFDQIGVSNSSNLSFAENCTPVGKSANGNCLGFANFIDHETVIEDLKYDNNGNTVKTPPVEASLSPEIQRQSSSKMLVLKSAVTPVCYGDGHLLSGVTDKRKCRRRGSLRGGSEKVNLFYADEDVKESKESLIPSLVAASVRWHLSPCNEGGERLGIDSRHKLDRFRMICDDDDALGKLELLSSNSMLFGNESDYSISDGVGNKASEFEGLLKPVNYNVVGSLSVTSPLDNPYSGNGIGSREENVIGDSSRLSISSLSTENIIQTPDSDCTSDVCARRSRLGMHDSSFVWPELDSITETLARVTLSPRNEMPTWDAPGLGTDIPDMASPHVSVGPTQLRKNMDSVSSSWVSDTTFSNLSLSQMRVSWHDGLENRTAETDEFDSCCFFSDEEVNAKQVVGDKSCQRTCNGKESGQNKESDLGIGNDFSPVILDYEPCISTQGKEKSSSHREDACAESICTSGGGLVASDDSDRSYFHENRLFQVR